MPVFCRKAHWVQIWVVSLMPNLLSCFQYNNIKTRHFLSPCYSATTNIVVSFQRCSNKTLTYIRAPLKSLQIVSKPPNMGQTHFKDGYAVIEWYYNASWSVEEPIAAGRDGFQQRLEKTATKNKTDRYSSTNWAKCGRRQTGDEFLSRWVKEVVYPAAEQQARKYIQQLNQENIERRERWLKKDGGKLVEQGQKPPPLRVYEAFDGKMLVMHKPYARQEKPDFGLEIKWVR